MVAMSFTTSALGRSSANRALSPARTLPAWKVAMKVQGVLLGSSISAPLELTTHHVVGSAML